MSTSKNISKSNFYDTRKVKYFEDRKTQKSHKTSKTKDIQKL